MNDFIINFDEDISEDTGENVQESDDELFTDSEDMIIDTPDELSSDITSQELFSEEDTTVANYTPFDTPQIGYQHFDPNQAGLEVIGNPLNDMENWHAQTYNDTCAVATQEFIIDTLTGVDFSEDELRLEAAYYGWYTPGGGTPLECMGNLLEFHGVDVERTYGGNLEFLSEQLAQGQKVMVVVDSDEIWTAGQDWYLDEYLGDYPGIPGQDANHAVQIIGIDRSNPENPMVILNDPGIPDGRGITVPADEFVNAWADSNYFMVYTTDNATVNNQDYLAALHSDTLREKTIGGYYNADGSYHYTSDNIDRDPETGAIIRQW